MGAPTSPDLLAVAPYIVLAVASGLLLIVETFTPPLRRFLSELTLLAVAGAAWARLSFELPGPVWNGMLQIDRVSSFVDLYILAALFLTVWMAGPFLRRHGADHGEFYALVLLAAVGAMVMASSTDLLTIFLGLELLSIPLYVLNAFFRRSEISLEAGLKYFVVGAFASAFVVYGMALLYGAAAGTELVAIAERVLARGALDPLVAVGLAMVVGGLAFKLAVVPAHAWAPDVYQGSPTAWTSCASRRAGSPPSPPSPSRRRPSATWSRSCSATSSGCSRTRASPTWATRWWRCWWRGPRAALRCWCTWPPTP
jgi:NADH-quinone oxidoreductase subunit N